MHYPSCRCIVFVILLFIMQISANFSDYRIVFDDPNFLLEVIFQVLETDLDQNRTKELVISGKNYTGRELFCYWLESGPDFKPVVKWQSDNLYEDRSVLWTATGRWTATNDQLLVITRTHFYIYQASQTGLELHLEGPHNFQPLAVASGDLDGDGWTEIIVGKVGRIGSKSYDGIVQVWRFVDNRLEMVAESGLIGNIRGLTAGDIDGDGKSELFVEEGYRMESGNIHVFCLRETAINEIYCLKKAVAGAVYSLRVKALADGPKLVTGSVRGKLNMFVWGKSELVPVKETSFKFGLIDFEIADLNNDLIPELLLVGHPRRLMILTS